MNNKNLLLFPWCPISLYYQSIPFIMKLLNPLTFFPAVYNKVSLTIGNTLVYIRNGSAKIDMHEVLTRNYLAIQLFPLNYNTYRFEFSNV